MGGVGGGLLVGIRVEMVGVLGLLVGFAEELGTSGLVGSYWWVF